MNNLDTSAKKPNCNVSESAEGSFAYLLDELQIDISRLDDKKEQTTKKIEYVRSYVNHWLYVMTNMPTTRSITFIDAMCNAGIYQDGELGTAAEVCRLFAEFAPKHPNITFRLYINDKDASRTEICTEVCSALVPDSVKNITIIYAQMEVNEFLNEAAVTNKVPRGVGNAVLLFVDPYNARTVHINSMVKFIESRYCEVLFNWLSMDLTRNKGDRHILDCFDGLEIPEGADPTDAICDALRIGNMKYVFSYPFRNTKNAELYQIIFVTPNPTGLSKLKEALWETFDGAAYHRNSRNASDGQESLFTVEELGQMQVEAYVHAAQPFLLDRFRGKDHVPYSEISAFLLERTMVKEGQIINGVLKPLISKREIRKDGKVRVNNYKKDTYSFGQQSI